MNDVAWMTWKSRHLHKHSRWKLDTSAKNERVLQGFAKCSVGGTGRFMEGQPLISCLELASFGGKSSEKSSGGVNTQSHIGFGLDQEPFIWPHLSGIYDLCRLLTRAEGEMYLLYYYVMNVQRRGGTEERENQSLWWAPWWVHWEAQLNSNALNSHC